MSVTLAQARMLRHYAPALVRTPCTALPAVPVLTTIQDSGGVTLPGMVPVEDRYGECPITREESRAN